MKREEKTITSTEKHIHMVLDNNFVSKYDNSMSNDIWKKKN